MRYYAEVKTNKAKTASGKIDQQLVIRVLSSQISESKQGIIKNPGLYSREENYEIQGFCRFCQ